MHFHEVGGLFQLALPGVDPRGLDFAEQGQRFFKLAGQALAVEAEGGEGSGLAVEGGGDGESFLDLFRSVFDRGWFADGAQGEQIVFQGGPGSDARRCRPATGLIGLRWRLRAGIG
jgi:hypothetical protein